MSTQSFSHVQLYDPVVCSPQGSSVYGDSPGKNTRVGCHFLLQGIFLTQGLNLCLLNWQVDFFNLLSQWERMRKLRLTEIRGFSQGHSTSK